MILSAIFLRIHRSGPMGSMCPSIRWPSHSVFGTGKMCMPDMPHTAENGAFGGHKEECVWSRSSLRPLGKAIVPSKTITSRFTLLSMFLDNATMKSAGLRVTAAGSTVLEDDQSPRSWMTATVEICASEIPNCALNTPIHSKLGTNGPASESH